MATAAIAVYLLAQGQRDRRRDRASLARADARRVVISLSRTAKDGGQVLRVNNFGTNGVVIEHCAVADLRNHDSGVRYDPFEREIEEAPLLEPSAEWQAKLAGTSFYNLAYVAFADGNGARWRRRSTDLMIEELQGAGERLHWWQRFTQWAALSSPALEHALHGWWVQRAIRVVAARTARQSPTVSGGRQNALARPVSMRWARFIWGYWSPGEADPWLRPSGAAPLWGFAELAEPPEDGPVPLDRYGNPPEDIDRSAC